MGAYEDQCAPANPRMPMLADMKTIMEAAYYGTSFAEVRAVRTALAGTADDAAQIDAAQVEAAPGDATPADVAAAGSAPNGAARNGAVPVAAATPRRPRRTKK